MCPLERSLRGEKSIAELRVQPVVDGPRRKQNNKEDEERWGELGANLLQKSADSNRHPEARRQGQDVSAEEGRSDASFHDLAPFKVLFFAAKLRRRLSVFHISDNAIYIAYLRPKVKLHTKTAFLLFYDLNFMNSMNLRAAS